jgi:hypothetical protein
MSNLDISWVQLGQDIIGKREYDYLGSSVSLNLQGNIVAIGSPYNDASGNNSGEVSIYEYIDPSWIQLGQNINGKQIGDEFGSSVSLNSQGNIVAIAALKGGNLSGQVSIYEYTDSSWIQLGQNINGKQIGDQLGYSISLNSEGNILAIGAPYSDASGSNSGQVSIYEYTDSSWNQLGKDINGKKSGDQLGYSISLNSEGNILAIGAPYNDASGTNSGQVSIYEYNYPSWNQLGQDINGKKLGDQLGYSISLNSEGNILAIGAPYNDVNGTDYGTVSIYEYTNPSWSQLGQDIKGKNNFDFLGLSLSLNSEGNIVAIGAPYYNNDINTTNSGQVGIYEYTDSSWIQIGQYINGEKTDDYFGNKLSISSNGTIIAIGSKYIDKNENIDSGIVSIYQLSQKIPISNICFPAGTPINTDQGLIPIEQINSDVCTIRGNKIETITKTITQDKYLVCIEKDSLAKNIPSEKTIISKNHSLLYNRKMVKAKELLELNNEGIYKVKYNGSLLYNVLLENKHDKMIVNNLICETLDPKNGIARMYLDLKNSNYTDKEKQEFIKEYNEYIKQNKTFNSKK